VNVPFPAASFTASHVGLEYTFVAHSGGDTLEFSYLGEQPTALFSGGVIAGAVHYDELVSRLLSSNPCFVEGTLIRTPAGDVPVEILQVGDLVLTSSGECRPVKWVGHRVIDCRRHSNPPLVLPVRIAADAFGPNRPSEDLFVSSGHSVCVDLCGEVLIPVSNLINGATIVQVEVDEVSYWHVELDSHDILLANNLPAESYMEMGNRGFFEEAGEDADASDERRVTHADFCRPVITGGDTLAFVRQRLLLRAEAIGWTPSRETDLHLIVDGEVRRPLSGGDAAVFLFPANARDVRLMSNTFIPAMVGGTDPRSLGLSLVGLVFSGGRGEARSVSLDDERLVGGLHPEEGASGSPWRWTKGELVLTSEFWGGFSGHVALTVTSNNAGTRQWVAPTRAEQASRPRLYAVNTAPATKKKAQAGR
jgi:hypothetical protein